MRKDFYIFRHGETDVNKEGRRQGQKINANLNEKGFEQAKSLAGNINNLGIEIIYSSPLMRAKQTAEVVASKLKVDVKFDDDLMEGCFGIFEGLLKEDVMSKYLKEHELWESMDEKDFDYGLPGGETKREISNRMHNALNRILNTDYNKVAISTHGRITRLYLYSLGKKLNWVENGAFHHVVYENGKWSVES